jgi:hypothetical protein
MYVLEDAPVVQNNSGKWYAQHTGNQKCFLVFNFQAEGMSQPHTLLVNTHTHEYLYTDARMITILDNLKKLN